MKLFVICVAIVATLGSSLRAQPKKSPYTIENAQISVVTYRTNHDNSGINTDKAFTGSKPLPASWYRSDEKHLQDIRQLSFDGVSTHAKFSPNGLRLCFESRSQSEGHCNQILSMTLDGKNVTHISTGTGLAQNASYLRDGKFIVYSSTFKNNSACPDATNDPAAHLIPLYKTSDLFVADTNGVTVLQLIADTTFYDAQSSVCSANDNIVFTSTRDGDINIYSLKKDSLKATRLTSEQGYDGEASYSPDGTHICYCESHVRANDVKEYKSLLAKGEVKIGAQEIMVMNADGSSQKQVTHNGKTNCSPCYFPDGKRILFSSNMDDPKGTDFDLYAINTDGTSLERITHSKGFDGDASFSQDGKQIVWSSERNAKHPGDMSIFVADWHQ